MGTDYSDFPPWFTGAFEEAVKRAKDKAAQEEAVMQYTKYASDPIGFCREVLDAYFTPEIDELLLSVRDNPITVARSANATGKSFAAARVALWFFKAFPDAKVFMAAAPPLENLQRILWGEMMHAVRKHPDVFKTEKIKAMQIWRHDQSFIDAVAIPVTGTAEEREGKFCADADDLFETHEGKIVKYRDLVGSTDVPVVSVDGDFQRKWSLSEFFNNGTQLVYEIKLDDGEIIRRTGNHPLYTCWNIKVDHKTHDGKHEKGRIRPFHEGWLSVSEITAKHAVLCPDDTSFNSGRDEIDENTLKFLAYMIGDGCSVGKHEGFNRLQFTQEDNVQLHEFVDILEQTGAKYSLSNLDKYNWTCVSTHDTNLSDFMKKCGLYNKKSADKFIPGFVFELRREQVALFLNRLFSTDGWACMCKTGKYEKADIGYSSKSERLIRDVQRLLHRFGIHAKISRKIVSWDCNGDERSGIYWSLCINHSIDVTRFAENIGIYGKEDAVAECLEYSSNISCVYAGWKFEKPGYRWKRVKSIKCVGKRPTVGVHVPGDNTYLTSLVEHNSGKHAPHILFIVDEGDAVPDEVYKGIESCMSGGYARLLILFNPRAKSGPVFELEDKGAANVVVLSAFDHPNVVTGRDEIPGAVDREITVRRINAWTRPLSHGEEPDRSCFEVPEFLVGSVARALDGKMYQPLPPGPRKVEQAEFWYMVLARYPDQDSRRLINDEWIDEAIDRWKTYRALHGDVPPSGISPIISIDCAEYGTDSNGSCLRYGGYVAPIIVWGGLDVDETTTKALELYKKHGARIAMVDGTGIGAGVAPAMARRGRDDEVRAVNVKVSEKPTKKPVQEIGVFRQLRDQLWWSCREWLRTDPTAMIPDDYTLREELRVAQYEVKNGIIKVMDKETFREKIKRSPDRADALCLTFAPFERAKVLTLEE